MAGGFSTGKKPTQGTVLNQNTKTPAPAPANPNKGPLGATYNGAGTVGTKESINAPGGTWYKDGNGNWVQNNTARRVHPNAGARPGIGSGQTNLANFGASGKQVGAEAPAAGAGGGFSMPDFGSLFGDGGLGGAGGLGGLGGGDLGTGGGVPAFDPLSIEAKPSPEMGAALDAWKKRMGDAETGLAGRMSSDNTQRSIDRALGSLRSQAAGMAEGADAAGAKMGRGPGYGAASIGDTQSMAGAKAAADISLGREQQLDNLFLGGQSALNAAYGMNPYEATANLGLGQQELGLKAYLGQLDAQAKNAETAARIAEVKAKIYGTPMQWYQTLLGML